MISFCCTAYSSRFVSDLRQIGGFPPGTPVSSTNKTDYNDTTEILLKVALNTGTSGKGFLKENIKVFNFCF
jgi:hypothetical protein